MPFFGGVLLSEALDVLDFFFLLDFFLDVLFALGFVLPVAVVPAMFNNGRSELLEPPVNHWNIEVMALPPFFDCAGFFSFVLLAFFMPFLLVPFIVIVGSILFLRVTLDLDPKSVLPANWIVLLAFGFGPATTLVVLVSESWYELDGLNIPPELCRLSELPKLATGDE